MAKAKNGYNPVRTGYDPRQGAKNNGNEEKTGFLSIAPNAQHDVVCLVEAEDIIAVDQCAIWLTKEEQVDGIRSPVWVFTGPEDPSLELSGVSKAYRAFLPVIVDDEVKVWPMGILAHRQLLDISDATGSLAGLELRLKRTGSGKGTRYSVVSTGKRFDVEDNEEVNVIDLLGPLEVEGVRKLIAERLGKADYDEVLDAYRGKPAKPVAAKTVGKATAGKKSKAKPVVEEDDEEEEEFLLEDEDDE